MNILILSCGTRNKIIQYFKETLGEEGKVVATDCSNLAPALYEADKYYIVSRMIEDGYLDEILEICKKEKINGVLSLIDPELSLLALNKDKFSEIGTVVIGSSYDLCELSLDKYEMYLKLKHMGFRCAKSYVEISEFEKDVENNEINFPVFLKPIKGSASISISKVEDMETLKFLFGKQEGLLIQEYLNGQEIGADVYIDMISNEVVSIFTKKKLVMRAGETDKAVSFKGEKLFAFIEKFVSDFGYSGQIDVDIFEVDGVFYISEVNPRFGGGYPHAYECGVNHMLLICKNLRGHVNQLKVGDYGEEIYMMKYNEVVVR